VSLSRQKIGSIDDVGQRRPIPISLTKRVIYSGDDNLIRVIDSDPSIQNLDRFIFVLRMADGRMNHSKSDHDFNPEIRGGHVRIDARASLREERATD
jgi:hypothetical protein